MKLSDATAQALENASEQEVLFLHARLHALWKTHFEYFKDAPGKSADGLTRESVIGAHLLMLGDCQIEDDLTRITRLQVKGGPGSGHRGHRGIPGQRGGSAPSFSVGFQASRDRRKLVREFTKTWGTEAGDPFWRADGEETEYVSLRDLDGKLVGGATLYHYVGQVDIASIESHVKGGGREIVEQVVAKYHPRSEIHCTPQANVEGFWKKVGFELHKETRWETDWIYTGKSLAAETLVEPKHPPYEVRKDGPEEMPYCVYNSATGERVGCTTKEKLNDYLAALHMHMPESEKGGPGSGHHGHRGVPGQRGGSVPGAVIGLPEAHEGWSFSRIDEDEWRDSEISGEFESIDPSGFDVFVVTEIDEEGDTYAIAGANVLTEKNADFGGLSDVNWAHVDWIESLERGGGSQILNGLCREKFEVISGDAASSSGAAFFKRWGFREVDPEGQHGFGNWVGVNPLVPAERRAKLSEALNQEYGPKGMSTEPKIGRRVRGERIEQAQRAVDKAQEMLDEIEDFLAWARYSDMQEPDLRTAEMARKPLIELGKGGPGSGHHGHRGVPGQRGGSSPGGMSGSQLALMGAKGWEKFSDEKKAEFLEIMKHIPTAHVPTSDEIEVNGKKLDRKGEGLCGIYYPEKEKMILHEDNLTEWTLAHEMGHYGYFNGFKDRLYGSALESASMKAYRVYNKEGEGALLKMGVRPYAAANGAEFWAEGYALCVMNKAGRHTETYKNFKSNFPKVAGWVEESFE